MPYAQGLESGEEVEIWAKNAIQSLVLKVLSLKKAETFLSERGMLGARGEGRVTIAPEKIYGLDVRLVE